eukprot:TRINITY_DN54490_c0_g1_i2.p1 TRINITY_DN54490_c0_g1~~TRINITY_DN54490_c0_g1_i2.p1  ORF type:complete len:514 (+),score=102.27 TRINITY_DN54490_c0_g1_i2:195-1736(+)
MCIRDRIAGNYDYGLPLNEVTLADKLKDAGYATHAVGKWHLGNYNFESTPTYRGFDTYLGYWSGAEDYYTHAVGGYLDLHRQWNQSDASHGTYQSVADETNTFSTPIFAQEMTDAIVTHKEKFSDQPGFFYLPLQNVHEPLESPGGKYDEQCKDVANSDRKTYCAMAAIADEAIGNLTSLIEETFAGESYLMVISGDNGGIPMGAGNNWPLRGTKGELWEGGIRNNAVLWGSMVPKDKHGTNYNKSMVHVKDWHATFVALSKATLPPRAPIDGVNVWDSIVSGAAHSSNTGSNEFLINYDPCSGHGACAGEEWGYREHDLKLLYGTAYDYQYPVPTSDQDLTSTSLMAHTGMVHDVSTGSVWWPEEHYAAKSPANNLTLSPGCVAAVKNFCPNGTLLCRHCITKNWDSGISDACSVANATKVSDYMCYGINVYLYNVTADPTETNNLVDSAPDQYADSITRIQAKVKAIVNGGDYLAPPNIPGGRCADQDPNAAAVCSAHGELYPWVNTTTLL